MKKRMNSTKKKSAIKRKEILAGYMFLLPSLLCLLIWTVYPIINSFWYSLTDNDVLNQASFIGLENYKNLLNDKNWRSSLLNTFRYVLIFVPSIYLISLISALFVKQLNKCKSFFRTAYFLPVVVSPIAAGSIFKLLLNTRMGLINKILEIMYVKPINFLGEENALTSCVVLAIWLGFGGNMIIFLAGLQDIPTSYYESARIDGANGAQQFWYITFPCLAQTSIFVFSMSFINSFQTYDVIKMLTDGGPNYATTLVVQRIYMTAFTHYEMGYACTMTVVLFVIIFTITIAQYKMTSKMADNGWM